MNASCPSEPQSISFKFKVIRELVGTFVNREKRFIWDTHSLYNELQPFSFLKAVLCARKQST